MARISHLISERLINHGIIRPTSASSVFYRLAYQAHRLRSKHKRLNRTTYPTTVKNSTAECFLTSERAYHRPPCAAVIGETLISGWQFQKFSTNRSSFFKVYAICQPHIIVRRFANETRDLSGVGRLLSRILRHLLVPFFRLRCIPCPHVSLLLSRAILNLIHVHISRVYMTASLSIWTLFSRLSPSAL